MLSFIVVIVCGFLWVGANQSHRLSISVLPLEFQLSGGRRVGISLSSLTPACFVNVAEPGIPKSYVMVFLCSSIWGESWLFALLIWVTYWPSLCKLSLHIVRKIQQSVQQELSTMQLYTKQQCQQEHSTQYNGTKQEPGQ